jgi:hypothetical protein
MEENKLYFDGKEVATIGLVIIVDEHLCVANDILFNKYAGQIDPFEFGKIKKIEITTPSCQLLGCNFTKTSNGIFDYDKDYYFIKNSELCFLKHIEQKNVDKKDHQGQIYNPYNDSWSWL